MENRNVIRFAFTVGGFTLLSRLLGMIREMLLARVFGTTLAMSAFVVAFRIPNLFRALFGEGALSSAFIPVFMESRRRDGETAAWQLARRVTTLVGLFLMILVILGIAGMGGVLRYVPDLSEKTRAVLPLARIMLPYVFFICMAALAMAVLNSYRKFSVSAFTPALLNITMILSLGLLVPLVRGGPSRQVELIAWTVLAAGAVQLAYQTAPLWRVGWRPGIDTSGWRDPLVRKVFLLMGPGALGMAINQINVLLNSLLALRAGDWAPSALYYAERLIYLPQGILATSLGTVLLSVLSDYAAQRRHDDIRDAIHHGLRTLLFVMTPAAIGLCVLAAPVVQLIYQRGEFTPSDTVLTARALRFYAPGLMAFCLAKVFVPAFYALQDTKTPVKIGICSVTLCLCLNLLSIRILPEYWKHAGLALSTVLAECFNGAMLAIALRRRLGPLHLRSVTITLMRALFAALLMALVAWGTEHLLTPRLYLLLPLPIARWISIPTAILAGAATYLAIARIFRFPELRFVTEALHRKRAQKPPLPA